VSVKRFRLCGSCPALSDSTLAKLLAKLIASTPAPPGHSARPAARQPRRPHRALDRVGQVVGHGSRSP
jgi:hypothetical protein